MHLKAGDPKPVISPIHFTLFGNRFCPYVERVRFVLSYHHIEYDYILIDLHSKPPWYLELYSAGKVPLLLTDKGEKIVESDVIMRHVDRLHGDKHSLLKKCSESDFEKACSLSSRIMMHIYPLLYRDSNVQSEAKGFYAACREINEAIKGPYFAGPELSLADLAILPFLNRLEPALDLLTGGELTAVEDLKPDDQFAKDYPKLATFLFTLRAESCVAAVREPARLHGLYAATARAGQPQPDM
ncbi:unnamed protein product [Calicophoron daubneyi]|uniref:GST N-terminal domain-containing protein n=1 Tax=Calicophoron daubneyi TaxID=300641 RepID=A0AAV2TC70_CALDB